ncbi:DUF4241 domain-containing protein [Streptomyces sp. NPDC059175]|uniref:DUF4241 domain-containing protein n=1 Tax=Streptomyces sp. NPDC059175 TaxID=3346757 RepID=UPI003693A03C
MAVVEVSYGETWNAAEQRIVGPLSRSQAAARDAQGAQYSVVLQAPGRPQPSAVLNVCWEQHYLGIWAYDEYGRRWREVDLRRLEPGRLFLCHMTQWCYESPGMAEFADDAGRSSVDLGPDGTGRRTVRPRGNRGPSTWTDADVPDGVKWVPAPDFGEWTALFGALGGGEALDVVLRDAPVASSDARGAPGPGWKPPTGMRPRHVNEMFTVGSAFSSASDRQTGSWVVQQVREAGPLRLPTGRVLACDPGWGWLERGDGYTVTVAPGSYPVEIARAAYASGSRGAGLHRAETVAARLVISGRPAVSWEPALQQGNDPRLLRNGEYFGFGVDSGAGCFVDASAVKRLGDQYDQQMTAPGEYAGELDPDGVAELVDPLTGANLVAFPSGTGGGSYPVWIGRDADGEVACFVADMLVLHRSELLRRRP